MPNAEIAQKRKVFISAGEASGDFLGARLMMQLKAANPMLELVGVGGAQMQAEGLDSLFPMEELSLMGFLEVLPHLFAIKRRLDQTIKFIHESKPDVIITIDSPGFHFALIKRLKKKYGADMSAKCIHYVAPAVWAWRQKRAKKISHLYDHILTLFPFEPPYFEKYGLKATFVGHPLVEINHFTSNTNVFRKQHAIPEGVPLLCVLPGSRRGELNKLMPIFEETIGLLSHRVNRLHVVIPTLPKFHQELAALTRRWPASTVVTSTQEEKVGAFRSSQAALAASGTIALELALARVPMVIAYRINTLTAWLVKRLIKIPFVCLVNILLKKRSIPEILQENCKPGRLAEVVSYLLEDTTARQRQIDDLSKIDELLASTGKMPSVCAADVIATYLKK
ncbi:MAG: lipid-A-disaccharide synthase [Alphaproteobacteria bacterium]|nr:lipid-A-disaccharide synthase [Alphaproteobacteria bacterium]OJV45116.1 MAG: lipid-A-disaccharide synthase [Alphaproteobacteria bacterium 43-37]